MKDHKFTLQNLTEITLTKNDMFLIHQYYERESIYEYLEENYDWDEETLKKVASQVHYLMKYKDYTEEDAINRCIKDCNLSTEKEEQ